MEQRSIEFDDEDDIGYMYVIAQYTDESPHYLNPNLLNVTIHDLTRIDYDLQNDRHRIGVQQNALYGTSCNDMLMTVALNNCPSTAVQPPLILNLPTPIEAFSINPTQTTIGIPVHLQDLNHYRNDPQ